MGRGSKALVLREFRTLFGSGTVAGLTDRQLLERFVDGPGESAEVAFAALVSRHGPMVLGVCRRALDDANDVDDAFQATFLVLVRRARSVRVDDSLGRWLYGVSRKVAARARAEAARRPRFEPKLEEVAASPRVEFDREILDQELDRLPEPFRSAVVLCDLDGLTQEEAARDLRCPVGTIKSRLARGRARLKGRLIRRGIVGAIVPIGPRGFVSSQLSEITARTALRYAIGGGGAVGTVPAATVALMEGVVKGMITTKLTLLATAVVSVGLAAGAAVFAQQQEGGKAEPGGKPAVVADAKVLSDPLLDKLDPPISVNFKEATLGQAVDQLMGYTGLNIIIDPLALQRAGLRRETRVNLVATQLRLGTVLKSLLQPIGLTYKVEDGVILITTPPKVSAAAAQAKVSAAPAQDDLDDQLEQYIAAYFRLGKATALAKDPQDPAVARAKKRAEDVGQTVKRLLQDRIQTKRANQAPATESRKVSMPEYVVEPPDIISVEVSGDLGGRPISGERLVRPDGRISLGFYGEVYVSGLTTRQIKEKIILHLRDYVTDEVLGLTRVSGDKTGRTEPVEPAKSDRVSVDVVSYNSKVYYVQGDVGTPGRFNVTGNETVLDAINHAGGLVPTVSKPNIRLIRPAPPGGSGEQVLPVDLKAIIERGDSATNYQILPGDRLVVFHDPEQAPASTPTLADHEARIKELERKLETLLAKPARPGN